MSASLLTVDQMVALRSMDTPWVCNALEVVSPERRASGFTTTPIGYVHPGVTRIVAYARTARIRSSKASGMTPAEIRAGRLAYYTYVQDGGPQPSVCVIEDIDPLPGFGALWGEVNTAVHYGLGCRGVITNGGVRDLDDCAPGFQMLAGNVTPAHAHIHIVDFDTEVTVFGMKVRPGDIIHADKHGAAAMSVEEAIRVPEVGRLLQRKEAVTLAAARQPGFTVDALREALSSADDIH